MSKRLKRGMREEHQQARDEIMAAIKFYSARGWDWFPVVAFIAAKAFTKRESQP